MNPFVENSSSVAAAAPNTRAEFIRKTYIHVAFAILAFMAVESVLVQLEITYRFALIAFSSSFSWLGILGAFMLVSWLARALASSMESRPMQYAGLAIYVIGEAIIFAPLIIYAQWIAGPEVILDAAIMTLVLFGGLTATVFITRKDFSFLGSTLCVIGFLALGLIVYAAFFPLELGIWFSVAMIAFASAAILYDTSKALFRYEEDQYIIAALEIFASVALLFWYMIRLFMSLAKD